MRGSQQWSVEATELGHTIALFRAAPAEVLGSYVVLGTRRERPRGSRAAKRDDQFPPTDVDCHVITPLGCCRCSEATPEMASR